MMAALLHLPEPQQEGVSEWQAKGGYGIICAGTALALGKLTRSCAPHIWCRKTEGS